MTAQTFAALADQLSALAAQAPGAQVVQVSLIGGTEITVSADTAEQREAMALALGLSGEPDLVGDVNRPRLRHHGRVDLDGHGRVGVSLYGPVDA